MTPETSIHHWFADQIAAYLTDGLDPEERTRFDAHAHECPECADKLADAKTQDDRIQALFGPVGPSADFEDRIIRKLRVTDEPRFALRRSIQLHPKVMRAAGAAAAILLLGGLGFGLLSTMDKSRRSAQVLSDANVMNEQAAPSTQLAAATMRKAIVASNSIQKNLSYAYANPYPNLGATGKGYRMVQGLEPTFGVAADINPGQNKDREKPGNGADHFDFRNNPFAGRDTTVTGTSRAPEELADPLNRSQVANDAVPLAADDEGARASANQPAPVAAPALPYFQPGQTIASSDLSKSNNADRKSPQEVPSVVLKTDLKEQQVAADTPAQVQQPPPAPAINAASVTPKLVDKLARRRVTSADPGNESYYRPDADRALAAQQQLEQRAQQDVTQMSLAMDAERQKMNAELKKAVEETNVPTPTPQPSAPQTTTVPANPPPADESRKIIRNGEMSFQVDSFDSAFLQITKIAAEEGGFVADTESEKLPNGKMSGAVTVRVPPDHLDTLALKLRALGDLTGQKINAQDVTKEYTDLQSELRAAKAMEDRLLDIIKTGNGQVKDLVAAEREVGVWREKVEKVTGEINYYNNLISLSTLCLTLEERDIRRAALASETETVDMGIETTDVEKARADAMRALDGVKARIIQADLKKLDAGQLDATIVADVSPDAAGPVIDHFKQLGRVARLNIDRQQTVAEGATVPPGVKVERRDTRLQISLYNLANVSPRESTNITMACPDVESAYHAILSAIADAGGRVVDSSLNRVKPDQTDGSITFETPREKADSVLTAVRGLGEIMHLALAENPDAANVTTAKEGFAITLASQAIIPARETIVTTLMPAGPVADAYRAILATVRKNHGNISTAQLQEQNSQSDSATLIFDVNRDSQPALEKAMTDAIGQAGRVIARQNSRSNDTQHTLDSKVQYSITFASADALLARETITRVMAVEDVSGTYSRILAAAQQAGAKVVAASADQSNPSNPSGQLDFIVARDHAAAIEKAIADSKGGVVSRSVSRSADLATTTDDKLELRLAIGDISQLPPRQTTTLSVDASDPESASANLQAAVLAGGGRIVEQHLVKDDRFVAHLVVMVPLAKGADFLDQVRDTGAIQTIERTEDQTVPAADFAQAKLDITLNASSAAVGPQSGLWSGIKAGIGASIRGLAFSLELILIGGCFALPWIIAGWLGFKTFRRFRKKSADRVSPQPGAS